MKDMMLIGGPNVKALQPAAKTVLIQLADFHKKSPVQPKRFAVECEMGRAILFWQMVQC